MSAKLTISMLSVFFLWSSLLAPRYKNNLVTYYEISKGFSGVDPLYWKKKISDRLTDAGAFVVTHLRFHLLFKVLRD